MSRTNDATVMPSAENSDAISGTAGDGIPDHSVISRARHERFRQDDALRRVFEGVMAKCYLAGFRFLEVVSE
jgi:hypothetical protein